MIDFSRIKTSLEDVKLAALIAKRAVGLNSDVVLIEVAMDIEAAHWKRPLYLRNLLAASDENFAHDVFGIIRHLDRETGELRDCFVPRYAVRRASPKVA